MKIALSMDEGNLKHHRKRIVGKLAVTHRTEATLVAVQRGTLGARTPTVRAGPPRSSLAQFAPGNESPAA